MQRILTISHPPLGVPAWPRMPCSYCSLAAKTCRHPATPTTPPLSSRLSAAPMCPASPQVHPRPIHDHRISRVPCGFTPAAPPRKELSAQPFHRRRVCRVAERRGRGWG